MEKFRVTASLLNLREGPGRTERVIDQLPQGTQVTRSEMSSDRKWSRVQAELDGEAVKGWVFSSFLSLVGESSTVENVVVDLSHHNGHPDLAAAKGDGIAGVIHKATQGFRFVDPMYTVNRQKAQQAGLLWGAYHFGVGGDAFDQADHFLETVNPGAEDLLVLDFESNPGGSSMTLDEARDFVMHVHSRVGRWPGLYSGNYIKEQLGGRRDEILSNTWFWLAQYGPTARVPANWSTWTMWQYTDGALGPEPHTVAGIGRCDRDKFNGDQDDLQRFWKGTG